MKTLLGGKEGKSFRKKQNGTAFSHSYLIPPRSHFHCTKSHARFKILDLFKALEPL